MVDIVHEKAASTTTVPMVTVERLMSELAGGIGTLDELPDYLERTVHAVMAAVDGCDAVGITVVMEDRPRTAAYTTAQTLEIDAVQYAVGDGPCLDAFRNCRENLVDVESAHDLWPAFMAAAPPGAVRTLLALPLVPGKGPSRHDTTAVGSALGALNLYAYQRHAFDTVDRQLVRLAATRAADAIATAVQLTSARELAGQLEQAMASRATIEQAKGIIIGRHGVDEGQAFEVLRRQSQDANVKLRELAATLVASATGVAPPQDAG